MNAGPFRRSTLRQKRIGLLLLGLTLLGMAPPAAMARGPSSLLTGTAALEHPGGWDRLPANARLSRQLEVADQTSRLLSARMGALRKRIEASRQARDIVLLSCLNETLSEATPWVALAETALVLARRALGPDPRQAAYELRRVATGQVSALKKLEAADRCESGPRDDEDVPVTSDGDPAAYDAALIDPFAPYHPDPSEPAPFSP